MDGKRQVSLWVDATALEMLDTIGEMEGLTSRSAMIEHLVFGRIEALETELAAA